MGLVEEDGHLTQHRAWFAYQSNSHAVTNDLNLPFDEDIKPVGLASFVEKDSTRIECQLGSAGTVLKN
jgi:hypothetical protein